MLFFGQTPSDAPLATMGLVNLLAFAVIVPFSMLMAPVGVKLGAKLDAATLKKAFALFLILTSARMFYQFAFQ